MQNKKNTKYSYATMFNETKISNLQNSMLATVKSGIDFKMHEGLN